MSRSLGNHAGEDSPEFGGQLGRAETTKSGTASFDLTIVVAPSDIDRLGHANNAVYLHWVERAVHGHWIANTSSVEANAYLWVAARHEIDYLLPAHEGESLAIATRLTEVRRCRAWYETRVSRGKEHLAQVRSCWCCIDATSRRLTVAPRDLAARLLVAQ